MDNEKASLILSQQLIESKIFSIRGVQVVLDKDLADFYGVKSIRLREQMKRNKNRFPSDFVFQLNESEVDFMVSQNAIPSKQSLGGYLPYVFTEQGVAAVSAVLKSEKAAEVSIMIMRAFVAMRKFLVQNQLLFERINIIETKQVEIDRKINKIFDALENKHEKPDKGIFYNGQIYDAWEWISSLIKSAKKHLILIDNYVDDTVLTLFSKKREQVVIDIYTKNISNTLKQDALKFNEQYTALHLHHFADAHDRFLIIDDIEVYHIGASLKDLGKKWFAFSKMGKTSVQTIIEKISKL
ncbi:MAG: ORF6N domain-containing protein [Bacteroidales bacterium]|nr:ORF6N domain-containing protein [Bacteroidales bacterium]